MFRVFVGAGAPAFETVRASGLLSRLAADGLLLPADPVDPVLAGDLAPSDDAIVVEQMRVPVVSYPYEWPFEMLRRAALLQLEILERALASGFILKDATPYNIQFLGTRPVFVDLGSFLPYVDGQPWDAYAQFCRTFLNPLLLASATGVAYQPWLRSSLGGIPPGDLARLLPWRHRLKPTVFIDVLLQAYLQRHFSDIALEWRKEPPEVPKRTILDRASKLRNAIRRLRRPPADSLWLAYEETRAYGSAAIGAKMRVVARALDAASPHTVLDLGCNRGEYAMAAAERANLVVAVDSDPTVVDELFLRAEPARRNILPLVVDVLNPSPDQGWNGGEREGWLSRARADFVLCLALLHHLVIGGNVPVRAVAAWLARLAPRGLLEFAPSTDPTVARMVRGRVYHAGDYSADGVRAALLDHYGSVRSERLPDSERILFEFGPA